MNGVRKIEVVLPDKEMLEQLESFGVDVEAEFTREFIKELKERLDLIRGGK